MMQSVNNDYFLEKVRFKLWTATLARMDDIEKGNGVPLDSNALKRISDDVAAIAKEAGVRNAVRSWLIQNTVVWSPGGLSIVDGAVFNSPSPLTQAVGGVEVLASVEPYPEVTAALNYWRNARIDRAKQKPNLPIPPDVSRAQNDNKPRYASAANYVLVFDWIEDVGNS